MKEARLEELPFRRPLQILKETGQVTFLVFEGRITLLAKVDVRGIGHGSIAENIDEIQKTKRLREQILVDLRSRGSQEDIVPITEYIIHGPFVNTYSRFQVMVEDGQSLSSLSIKQICALPPQSLRDLRNIIEIYIHYLGLGKDIDILGNHYSQIPFLQKILRCWIALFWSDNILIDQSQIPRFIDIGTWGMESHPGIRGILWVNIQKIRCSFSIFLLDLILIFKK